jgi:hypothetical protein
MFRSELFLELGYQKSKLCNKVVSERVHVVVVASIIENDITPNFALLTHDSVSHEFAFALLRSTNHVRSSSTSQRCAYPPSLLLNFVLCDGT